MEHTGEKNKLFIGNLSRQAKRRELKEHFNQFGEVAYASVAFDREKRRAKGFGFITFVNEADAIRVKENNDADQMEFMGRPLFIEYAQPRESDTQSADDSDTTETEKMEETESIEEKEEDTQEEEKEETEEEIQE